MGVLHYIDENSSDTKLYCKTSAELVTYSDTTVANALGEISDGLANKQAKSDKLTAFSNLTLEENKIILGTGENSFSTTTLTATGKNIISSYTDKEIRKALGIYKNLVYDEMENVWQLNGSPAVSNGELVLDGASYIRSGNLFSLDGEFTFECYANSVQNSSLAYLEPIIAFTPADDTTQPFLYLRINNGTASDTNGPIGSYDFVAFNSNFSTFDIIHENVASWGEKKHLAVTFDGEKFSFYVDGVLIGTGNYINPPGSYRFYIGAQAASNTRRWQGTLDEVRLSDTCRYTENFTPAERFEVDENTLSLLHFDG